LSWFAGLDLDHETKCAVTTAEVVDDWPDEFEPQAMINGVVFGLGHP
jgi:hypothetical protein